MLLQRRYIVYHSIIKHNFMLLLFRKILKHLDITTTTDLGISNPIS